MKYLVITAVMILSSISFTMEPSHTPLQRGILIAIEGIDGSGKSTLARHLYTALEKKYTNVSLTKEPGDTPVGQKIRELVQTQITPLDAKTEYLLFAADRAEHFAHVIKPLLEQKHIIISDRLADSSLAYQGYGRNLDNDMIQLTNQWAMNNRKPDLTIFVKIPVKIALERIQKRNETISTFEKESFLQTVATGFEKIYENYCTIDRFEKFSKFNQEHYIRLLKQKRNSLAYPATTEFNLTTLDPEKFKLCPAKYVKLITIDGTKSETEIADKTVAIVDEWIAINNK